MTSVPSRAPRPLPRSVLMLLQSFHPHIGGAERQALGLSRVLMARGIGVTVVTRRLGGLPRRESVEGVPVVRLPAWGSGARSTSVFLASSFHHLLMQGGDADVVHVHLASSHAVAAALAGRLVRTPVIVKIGGAAALGEIGAAPATAAGRWKLAALRALRPQMVAVNEDQIAELGAVGLGGLPVERIPNGVDTVWFRPPEPAERERLRRELGWGGLVFLFAGRLASDKGQVEVLRSFLDGWRLFLRRWPAATFLLAGTGPEEGRFRIEAEARGLRDSVRFLGPREDLADLYRAADAFVLLSLAEGMSNALLEAMASGLPVVAARVSGVLGVVDEGVQGVLFDPASAEEAETALGWIAENRSRSLEVGLRARRTAEAHSIERTADRWIDLYARCMERVHARR